MRSSSAGKMQMTFLTRRAPLTGTPALLQQGDEDFVGDGQARGRKPHASAGALDEALDAQFLDACADRCFEVGTELRSILGLDARQIDAFELAQAEKKLFIERLLRGDFFELLDRESPLLDRRSICGGIVSVGPAQAAVEGMRAGAEAEIRFAAPIFEIVPRTKARQRPIGDFVVVVAGAVQAFAREFVGFRHGIVTGNGRGGIARSAGEQFAAETAAFVDLEEINGNVFGTQAQRFLDRLLPARRGLVRQAGDEIEADMSETGGTKALDRGKDIFAAVHASSGL